MPVICDPIPIDAKLCENLSLGFKKSEKENYETHPTPTAKQILSAKIEYEEVPNLTSSTLNALQAKYTVLKPNQQPLTLTATNVHANSKIAHTNNDRNSNCANGSLASAPSTSVVPGKLQLAEPKRVLYPKELLQVGWQGPARTWGSGCGLSNIGNTCYLNSALQALFHVPVLAQWLLSDKEHRERSNCKEHGSHCLICAMAYTLLHTHRYNNNNGSFTPSLITNRLQQICKHLTLGRQEDAHEFLRCLIEKMEKSYLFRSRSEPWFKELDDMSKETTPLNLIVGGYLRSTVTCLSCNHESVTLQHFQDLPLDITRGNTLNEAIAGYFSREPLEECGYKCESCKKRVSASKKFTLDSLPIVMCIQLKRFTGMGGKTSKHIQIHERLNFQKYRTNPSNTQQDATYKLVSMITHLGGSANGGHYTAIGLSPKGGFYSFDDSRVSQISMDNALRSNTYVLFYELVQEPKNYVGSAQNGHSIFHENGHNYIKNNALNGNLSFSTSSASSSKSWLAHPNQPRPTEMSFSRPSLPKMLPASVMKQQQSSQQPHSSNADTSQKSDPPKPPASVWNGKLPPGLVKSNGTTPKRDHMSDSDSESKNDAKKHKSAVQSPLPSVPRLIDNDSDPKSPAKCAQPASAPSPSLPSISKLNLSSGVTPPSKPKSLVPDYETDDEEEDENGKKDSENRIFRTSSGIFIESDITEKIKVPSKQGSTIVTKASIAQTSLKSEPPQLNGKHSNGTNGAQTVFRGEDAVSQLTKLNHSGYGASNVVSWGNTPTNMNRELARDQQEERKRVCESPDDVDMDRGRVKKLRYNPCQNARGKLPNPFTTAQNGINNGTSNQSNGFYNDRPNNWHQNGNGNNRHGRPHHNNHNKNHNSYGRYNGNGSGNNNNRNFNNNRNNNNHRGGGGGGGYFNPRR